MRRLFLASLMMLSAALPSRLDAQDRNAVYAEVFGNVLLGSFNYERVLVDGFTARVGIGGIPAGFEVGATLQAPLMLNYLVDLGGPHRAEVGGGAMLIYLFPPPETESLEPRADQGFQRPEATATLAYRWQPAGRGGFYKLGFTPTLRRNEILPLFGLSAGVTF